MLAPIIVFTYRRAEFTRRILDALARNNLAKQSVVFVYSNASKDEKDREGVLEVREVIKGYNNSFKKYHVICRTEQLHVKQQMRDAIEDIFKSYDRVICLEDDIETSINFLDYVNSALDYYNDDQNIFSVGGYNNCNVELDFDKDTFLHTVFRSWGYGLWRSKYEKLDYSKVHDYLYKIDMQQLYKDGPSFYSAFASAINTPSYERGLFLDALFMSYAFANRLLHVFPKQSYCKCIDDNGSGLSQFKNFEKEGLFENSLFNSTNENTAFKFSNRILTEADFGDYYYDFIDRCFQFSLIRTYHGVAEGQNITLNTLLWVLCIGGYSIDYYFEKHNYKKIAIYACGYNGEVFYNLIKNSDYVEVVYAMDKNQNQTLPGVKMSQQIIPDKEVDVIVVTYTAYYKEIRYALNCNKPVVDILSVAIECAKDLGLYHKFRKYIEGEM